MQKYLIIADDITGSNDTGVQLKRRGIETVVTLDPSSIGTQDASYVLDTESRPLKGDAAFSLIKNLLSAVDTSPYTHVVKKVDSTLRGAIAREISAVDAVYNPDIIIFMPALPDLGRTTEGGIHKLNGKPITETELARDPRTPVREDNIKKLLEEVYTEPVTHIGLEAIERREFDLSAGRVFSFDATTNAHMQAVVSAAISTGKKILWVGTAGIVDNLVETQSPQYPSAALVASLSETSREQVQFAVEKGTEIIIIPTADMLDNNEQHKQTTISQAVDILHNKQDLIIISAASHEREELETAKRLAAEKGITMEEASQTVQKYMGEIMSGVLAKTRISGIFVTGGDTTMGFLNEIDATGLRIVSEVLIGIPLMRIVGGKHDNTNIITKAGAFGQKDALYFALRKLKEI